MRNIQETGNIDIVQTEKDLDFLVSNINQCKTVEDFQHFYKENRRLFGDCFIKHDEEFFPITEFANEELCHFNIIYFDTFKNLDKVSVLLSDGIADIKNVNFYFYPTYEDWRNDNPLYVCVSLEEIRDSVCIDLENNTKNNNNEVYLRGYFYLPTNSNNLEEALKVLEEIGFNMDNADEIELRDNEGNVIETEFDNILDDFKEDVELD